jgi:hypothetical protein
MREKDFSQIIALHDGRHLVLSTEGISRWLESKSKEDIISISDARLRDALHFEPKDSCVYLKANDTIDRAREVFASDIGRRIFCLLITEHASAKEKPLNILTPWDFLGGKGSLL